ncbi:GNAT family N-acetyltransferase [Anaerobacillus sp. CMMVII]|uniref:GNAT family N-acetyltransferase n=1 Tax=Anaerobacillus sp. CMMVII TaxID=2755588 RepID=UPI0021B8151E|nr:GNAT family protein [Anaerobacillus sp. CMMVII]MCT8137297.1 GNAT family N-acetyltransferase [Anaerobacillus sp. CMMVII]
MFVHKIDDDIAIRLISLLDDQELFKLTERSRSYLREWLPWLDQTTKVEDTREFIKFCLKNYAENKGLNTVILHKGNIVGVVGFNELDWSNKIAYIGYWLGHEYQGKGIMTKVTKSLISYAFNDLKLNRVDIRAAEGNFKSRAIPERLNFTNEGKIRNGEWLYDHYVDHIVYGMLKEEWIKEV